MAGSASNGIPDAGKGRWTRPLLICLAWSAVIALAISRLKQHDGILVAVLAVVSLVLTIVLCLPAASSPFAAAGWVQRGMSGGDSAPTAGLRRLAGPTSEVTDALTKSGVYDAPPASEGTGTDISLSGNFSITDMVSRLEPGGLHWIESSIAEQEFLGLTLPELRRRSFVEILHAADRPRALEAFKEVLEKGEVHGLVVRIRTGHGKTKIIEVNASARYGSDRQVRYVRCHLTDVTDKVRAERELRLRTRELTQVNEQLRVINRELVALKDRYSDLYHNAPAMYFSLDDQGRLLDCNQTFLTTLGRASEDLIGQGFERFVDRSELERCQALFDELLEVGSIETESRWLRSTGEVIPVWISGKVHHGSKGNVVQTRCVAQDLTAKHRLEAELREMNQSLARANAELSEKNRELDEFVYVVSHDLQEPLRTLIAFSDFLLADHSQRLDQGGQEYLRHLLDASRRMRSMIHGLLNLSRAGKVTEDFGPVDLGDLVEVVQADLRELIRSRHAEVRHVGTAATLWGDRRRLQQLIANLVSNGIKYNRSGVPCVQIGAVEVESDCGPSPPGPHMMIEVHDNGIGIDPRHHERIFHLFRRLHSTEEFEGTGVGLAICSKIVQAHGGQIKLESTPGQGTSFYVSLPRGKAE
jgi:PAS domain S-box-containing protein